MDAIKVKEDINELVKFGRLCSLMLFYKRYKNEGIFWTPQTCMLASSYGHLNCLQYLHQNGFPWDISTCDGAAENGHIECFKYAHENGCPWSSKTCLIAAANGHLECLKYAHENGCPWSTGTCFSAANKGHLECLKYAHENGCLWDNETCYFAAVNDQFECMKYAYENGSPYSKELLPIIAKKILIPKWRASVKIRPYAIYWMECSAQTSCAENGRARNEDINSFENDFNNLIV